MTDQMTPEDDGPSVDPRVGNLVDAGDIPGALRSLDRSLGGISYRMDRKFLRNLTVMIAGLFVVAIIVVVATVALVKANDKAGRAQRSADAARAALVQSQQDTQEARVGSCEQFNVQQKAQAKAEKDEERNRRAASSVSIVPLLDLLHISQAQYAAIQAERLASFDATVDQAHKLRDCSPEGVARYLEGVKPNK